MNYEKILKIITEHIDDGIFIVDHEGKVVFYNESADNQAGVNFENAIGKNILEIFPKLDHHSSTLLRVMQTKEPIIGHIQNYYNYHQKKVTIISTTFPIFEDGIIVGAVEISKDLNKYGEFNDKIDKIRNSKGQRISKQKTLYDLDDIIGQSQEIKQLKSMVRKVAMGSSPVIVTGATGTGKEMVVQSIHQLSERREAPFIAQNCAAIPVTLLESILFGTSVGSFTGSRNSPGLFELADKGTLFLDEINSMDIFLQAKLLRVLQDGQIRRIGDKHTRRVDVRIITAMNVSPKEALESGNLREDLYYRLNVLHIHIPPLKERKDDIKILTEYFIHKFNLKYNKNVSGASDEAFKELFNHDWPGNVRELEHAIERAVLMSEGNEINRYDLPEAGPQSHSSKLTEVLPNDNSNHSLKAKVLAYEKQIIEQALSDNEHSITRAAQKLGIKRQTLHYKMNQLEIKVKSRE
ncbi:MAG: sigma 54-interacting transcriptional regulator [Tissierellales bacterium]|nr:sigma 54-interacting transcriptional regulator [Tissierellales bacterium]MBN2827152.1 sigma 54-interacting transcriptional regulator [Tissierellales bacterium]